MYFSRPNVKKMKSVESDEEKDVDNENSEKERQKEMKKSPRTCSKSAMERTLFDLFQLTTWKPV
jgi:hypothetical protein